MVKTTNQWISTPVSLHCIVRTEELDLHRSPPIQGTKSNPQRRHGLDATGRILPTVMLATQCHQAIPPGDAGPVVMWMSCGKSGGPTIYHRTYFVIIDYIIIIYIYNIIYDMYMYMYMYVYMYEPTSARFHSGFKENSHPNWDPPTSTNSRWEVLSTTHRTYRLRCGVRGVRSIGSLGEWWW